MDDSEQSSRLLDLPAELRNRVWEALFSEPSERTIDQHINPRETYPDNDILSLSRVNHQLRRETLPFYWSCTIFRILHRGHRDDSGSDHYFYQWLQRITPDEIKHVRRLELKVKVPFVPPNGRSERDPSLAIISVDLNYPSLDEVISIRGYYSTCPLAIFPWLRKAVAKVPRVDRKPIVSKEVLWDIYEACYLLTRSDSRERRTWADFHRAYELNQSKDRPRPWSEHVYYEMSQEAIYGPEWRQNEANDDKKKSAAKFVWECR